MMGQTRVAFAMARDGLLPTSLAKVHPTFGTPYRLTAITGVGVALLSGFVDFATLGDLVSIGTLFAFMLVSVGVLVLRRTRPDLPRAFRTPAVRVVATLSVLLCFYLMLNLIGETWVRFLVWMADRPGRLLRLRPLAQPPRARGVRQAHPGRRRRADA